MSTLHCQSPLWRPCQPCPGLRSATVTPYTTPPRLITLQHGQLLSTLPRHTITDLQTPLAPPTLHLMHSPVSGSFPGTPSSFLIIPDQTRTSNMLRDYVGNVGYIYGYCFTSEMFGMLKHVVKCVRMSGLRPLPNMSLSL